MERQPSNRASGSGRRRFLHITSSDPYSTLGNVQLSIQSAVNLHFEPLLGVRDIRCKACSLFAPIPYPRSRTSDVSSINWANFGRGLANLYPHRSIHMIAIHFCPLSQMLVVVHQAQVVVHSPQNNAFKTRVEAIQYVPKTDMSSVTTPPSTASTSSEAQRLTPCYFSVNRHHHLSCISYFISIFTERPRYKPLHIHHHEQGRHNEGCRLRWPIQSLCPRAPDS